MKQKINDVRDRLIVALDVPTVWDAYRLVSTLGDGVSFYKIGYRLAFAGGLDLARQLVAEGKKVFLDLKLHDIGNTVTEGVDSLTKLGVTASAERALTSDRPYRPALSVDAAISELRRDAGPRLDRAATEALVATLASQPVG